MKHATEYALRARKHPSPPHLVPIRRKVATDPVFLTQVRSLGSSATILMQLPPERNRDDVLVEGASCASVPRTQTNSIDKEA
jgi:hypothetical protein